MRPDKMVPEMSLEDDWTELQHCRLPELHAPPVCANATPAAANTRATGKKRILFGGYVINE